MVKLTTFANSSARSRGVYLKKYLNITIGKQNKYFISKVLNFKNSLLLSLNRMLLLVLKLFYLLNPIAFEGVC